MDIFYGIYSERRLCEEIKVNLAYRWYCRISLDSKVPHHSSLTKIRHRLGEKFFKNIFDKIIRFCLKNKFLEGKRIIVDASIFSANASINSMVKRDKYDDKSKILKKHQERYHDFIFGKRKRKLSNQTHISKTDKDASLISYNYHHHKLAYKTHYSIDAESRIILDCPVTTGATHECIIFPQRIVELKQKYKLPIEEVIADKGYGRGKTYALLKAFKIRSYISLHHDNLGQGRISKGNFIYNEKKDIYICPEKHELFPYEKTD